MAKILDINQTITANGVSEIPILQQVTPKKTKQVGRVTINVKVPVSEAQIIEKIIEKPVEIIKEVQIQPTQEVCQSLYPPTDFKGAPPINIPSKGGIGKYDIVDGLGRYGVRQPSTMMMPHSPDPTLSLSGIGYNAIRVEDMEQFRKYTHQEMLKWWPYNAGTSSWMCVDFAWDFVALSHRWFPHLTTMFTYGRPAYMATASVVHQFVLFYAIDGKMYLIEPLVLGGFMCELSDPRAGLGSSLQLIYM